VKYQNKVRLIQTKDSSLPWQTYHASRGWETMGHLRHAILSNCKFSDDQSEKYIFCDTFLSVSYPMKDTVRMYGHVINHSPQYECDGSPITKCDEAIIMSGKLFKIA